MLFSLCKEERRVTSEFCTHSLLETFAPCDTICQLWNETFLNNDHVCESYYSQW